MRALLCVFAVIFLWSNISFEQEIERKNTHTTSSNTVVLELEQVRRAIDALDKKQKEQWSEDNLKYYLSFIPTLKRIKSGRGSPTLRLEVCRMVCHIYESTAEYNRFREAFHEYIILAREVRGADVVLVHLVRKAEKSEEQGDYYWTKFYLQVAKELLVPFLGDYEATVIERSLHNLRWKMDQWNQ